MRYISTRGGTEPLSFLDAVLVGQAPDGGLLIPEFIPNVRSRIEEWRSLSYQELAFELFACFLDDLPEADLKDIIDQSYGCFDDPRITPLVRVGEHSILELFHGPTLAFKDIGLQLLGNIFEYALTVKNSPALNILCATSGDTGGAAVSAIQGKGRMTVTVLCPKDGPSRSQRLQMTTASDANVHNLILNGTFDDCQRIVKGIFSDTRFKQTHRLGAVNSVNWVRILGQIVYYFYAWLRLEIEPSDSVVFVVPTGNFGNSFACHTAREMGLPVKQLLVATNQNSVLKTFFNTGSYRRHPVSKTLSPAMDIQVSSNIERYIHAYFKGDSTKVRQFFENFDRQQRVAVNNGVAVSQFIRGISVNDTQTLDTIESVWQKHQYMLDPHTAVGVTAAKKANLPASTPVVCLATAHPAKFSETLERALGEENRPRSDSLARLDALPERFLEMEPEQTAVMDYIRQTVDPQKP